MGDLTKHLNPRSLRSAGLVAAVVLAPLCVNGLISAAVVSPQQAALRNWQDTKVLADLKPRFESLLTESHHLLMDWDRTGFTKDDPAAITQAIDRLAGAHHVELVNISTKTQGVAGAVKEKAPRQMAGMSTMVIEVQLAGRFSKLAHWISDAETYAGLQIDSWTFASGGKPGEPHRLTVQMTAFLRNT